MVNKEKRVRVLIEQTGVETVVSQSYYDKYGKEGVILLREFDPDEPEQPASSGLTYKELKDALTVGEMTFKGNASKAELESLYHEMKGE